MTYDLETANASAPNGITVYQMPGRRRIDWSDIPVLHRQRLSEEVIDGGRREGEDTFGGVCYSWES